MAEYYDYVLAAIPLTVCAVAGTLALAGLSLSVAAPVGVAASFPVVGHALFVRAPVPASSSPAASDRATGENAGFDTAD